ncbi:MAG: MucR family transcriptional regulator [Hyphomonadaceae bacterium]
MNTKSDLVEMTAAIVAAYLRANPVAAAEIPRLIEVVHAALKTTGAQAEAAPPQELAPAVPVKKSVTDDFIICLEDGKKFKSLKRHLRAQYGMTPEEYRQRWNLPADYPMVAPAYAKARSQLAKRMGLGQGRRV